MSLRCLIASVENTGTFYVAGLVEQLTGEAVTWAAPVKRDEITTAKPLAALVQHVYPRGMFTHADAVLDLFRASGLPIIVPIRHPVRALISNVCRDKGALSLHDHVESFHRIALWSDTHLLDIEAGEHVESLADLLRVEAGPVDRSPKNVTPRTARYNELTALYEARAWSELDEHLDGQVTRLREFWHFHDLT